MPSVLFTKKVRVVVSLHKQTAWLPWRGFCTPRFQYLVQTKTAEASQGGFPFLLPTAPTHSWTEGRATLTFLGGHISGGSKSWTRQDRRGARLCLYIGIQNSEQPGRLSFCGWAISRQSTNLNIVQFSLMHDFFSTEQPEIKVLVAKISNCISKWLIHYSHRQPFWKLVCDVIYYTAVFGIIRVLQDALLSTTANEMSAIDRERVDNKLLPFWHFLSAKWTTVNRV